MTQEEHPIHHFPVASFSVNNNKTHKSRLEYEIKFDLYQIPKKLKTLKLALKNLKFGLLSCFRFLKNLKNLRFCEIIFHPWSEALQIENAVLFLGILFRKLQSFGRKNSRPNK